MRKGKIIPNGVKLEVHEYETVIFFTNLGKTIELIPPSNTPCSRRADFLMNGIEWEAKSPQKASKIVVERTFHKGLRQSDSIIIDLRHAKGSKEEDVINHLEKCFTSSKKAKRMIIFTKHKKLLDYKK